MAEWVLLARLLRPQGRRGELLADVLTDFPERFAQSGAVTLLPPEPVPSAARVAVPGPKTAELLAHWFPVGRNAGRIVLEFLGVDSISAAEALAGWAVALPESERMTLADDSVYISDLIGCTLYDGDAAVGVVEDVEFPARQGQSADPDAPALLSVMQGEREHLIPFVKAWLVRVDTANQRIEMRLPAGLLEINSDKS